ncbi:MAG TPA: class I SAM-dependent methyltransferase [Steroidobacteraceae bacterium]|jgi:hypothetical protein
MAAPARLVVPELLDELAPDDPRAERSRRDLQTIHKFMRSVSILRNLIAKLNLRAAPRRIIELGAGDGTLMLAVARSLESRWSGVELTLLDRVDLLTDRTRDAYRRLGWDVRSQRVDVANWTLPDGQARYDLCLTSLFLHHFDGPQLESLMKGIARRADAFVASEPRRDALGRMAALGVGLIGANAVTRGDAMKSVAAGFRGNELGAAWGHSEADWRVDEFGALPFSHCFAAVRRCRTLAGMSRA